MRMAAQKPSTLDCLMDLGSLIRLGWPASEPLIQACSYHPALRLQLCATMPRFLGVYSQDWPQVLEVVGQEL